MTSQTLSRLYASSGDDVLIHTLEIVYHSFRVRLAQSFENVTAGIESGGMVIFSACAMELSLPPSDSEGTRSLQFTVCNIDGSVQRYMRDVADWYSGDEKGAFPYLIYRGYISSDLTKMAAGPFEFYVNSVACNARYATITATYADVLNTSWPRGRYKSTDWPGLIYAS